MVKFTSAQNRNRKTGKKDGFCPQNGISGLLLPRHAAAENVRACGVDFFDLTIDPLSFIIINYNAVLWLWRQTRAAPAGPLFCAACKKIMFLC
jgi:hypothetical protein